MDIALSWSKKRRGDDIIQGRPAKVLREKNGLFIIADKPHAKEGLVELRFHLIPIYNLILISVA
jgi:hypothetical protein